MTKVDDTKAEILAFIKGKEYVIDAEFDKKVVDVKPCLWIFYRLNIMHKDAKGRATFSGKGVYIKNDGTYFFHKGGVSLNDLESQEVILGEHACSTGGNCEYAENSKGKYYCKKCLKIKDKE